jgi:hypothetical protein
MKCGMSFIQSVKNKVFQMYSLSLNPKYMQYLNSTRQALNYIQKEIVVIHRSDKLFHSRSEMFIAQSNILFAETEFSLETTRTESSL